MASPITATPGTLRPMLRLALPVLFEQLLAMLVGFSDTLLTGHYLDRPHLAAINLLAYLLWLLYGLFSVVAIGATAMVARYVGAGDYRTARRVTNQSLFLGACFALAAMLLGLYAGPRIGFWLRLSGESAAFSGQYLGFVVPVIPLLMVQVVGVACLRGAGDMVAGLGIMAVVNAVNVAVSWSLVLGLGPLPQMGWTGLALGTAAGYSAGGLSALFLLIGGRSRLHLHWRGLRPDKDLIRRLLRVGLPGGADTLTLIACQLWFVSLINRLGDLAAAAHGVAIRSESLAFLPGVAFQMAAATLAGQYLGAGDHRRAGRSVLMALLVGGGLMVTAGLIFFTQADRLPFVFLSSDQHQIARETSPLLRVVSLGMPPLALAMILSGALRGAGDTRWPLLITLVGFLGLRIPAVYYLCFPQVDLPLLGLQIPGWDLGVLGAWYAMVADLTLRSGLILFRFLHGGWKHVRV